MKFKKDEAHRIKTGHIEEISYYVKPSKKYNCPHCKKEKRKVLGSFEYYDDRKEILADINFEKPICKDCFDEKMYSYILNKYYEDDIY